jgi:hypothetical protein
LFCQDLDITSVPRIADASVGPLLPSKPPSLEASRMADTPTRDSFSDPGGWWLDSSSFCQIRLYRGEVVVAALLDPASSPGGGLPHHVEPMAPQALRTVLPRIAMVAAPALGGRV